MSEINETIRLAMEVVSTLEHDAEMFDASRCGESASVCRKEAAAIRELVALHTPKDRPTGAGVWILIERPDDPVMHWRLVDTNGAGKFYIDDPKVFGAWYGPFVFAAKQEQGKKERT